jgi:hypothetical protein
MPIEVMEEFAREGWIANGEGRARVAFSSDPAKQGVVGDIKAGIIRAMSFGYTVQKYQVTRAQDRTDGVNLPLSRTLVNIGQTFPPVAVLAVAVPLVGFDGQRYRWLGEKDLSDYGAFINKLVGLAKGMGIGYLVPDIEEEEDTKALAEMFKTAGEAGVAPSGGAPVAADSTALRCVLPGAYHPADHAVLGRQEAQKRAIIARTRRLLARRFGLKALPVRHAGADANFGPLPPAGGGGEPDGDDDAAAADVGVAAAASVASTSEGAGEADARTDVLSLFLRSTYDDGTVMTRGEIGDELLALLAAGHETTASTLGWAFERISRHPEVLERLVAEAAGEGNTYRQATILEVQRNRTVIDFAGRHVAAPSYELGEWCLPQGFSIMVSLLQLHRDPQVYPDPERFDPQRFIDDKPSTYSWVPFGGGVRRCVGAAFANMEMDVVLRTVLRHFTIRTTTAPGEKWPSRGVAFTPKKGGRGGVFRRATPPG